MPPKTANDYPLRVLLQRAKAYNAKLEKPISLSQDKNSLYQDLIKRRVNLKSYGAQLKDLVRKPHDKVMHEVMAKQRKALGTDRHVLKIIDRYESKAKRGKKRKPAPPKKRKQPTAAVKSVQHLVKRKQPAAAKPKTPAGFKSQAAYKQFIADVRAAQDDV